MDGLLLVVLVLAVAGVAAVALARVRAGSLEAAGEGRRLAEQERLAARRTMDAVLVMDDRAFEEFIADLCRRDGCTQVRRVGGAGDLGADVLALLPDGRRLVVQCKRYAPHRSVGSRDLQTFNGTARAEHGAQVALFVATCPFTAPARDFAAKQRLHLVDLDLCGFWNTGTTLPTLLDLDIARSGTHRRAASRPKGAAAAGPGRRAGRPARRGTSRA